MAKTDTTTTDASTPSVPDELTTTAPDSGNAPMAEPASISNEDALALATKAHDLMERAFLAAYAVVADGVHDELCTSRSAIRTLLQQLRACWPGGKPKIVPKEQELVLETETK